MIEMLFGLRTWVGPGNHVLYGVQIPPTERDNCEGGGQSGHKVGEKIISFPGFSIAIITARGNAHIASAVLAIAIPSVCLCLSLCLTVRLSHAGIVSKRRHVARCSLHCRIAKCV